MKYEDIKDFNTRCEEHPDHQTGMVTNAMIQQRLYEEIDELRDYIEQAEKQEPVAWMTNSEQDVTAEFLFSHVQTPMHNIPLYEAPPRKEWVGLTGEELAQLTIDNIGHPTRLTAAIEAKLKEKNL